MNNRHQVSDQPPVRHFDESVTKLRYVSEAQYSDEWNSTLHTHHCAEIFFVTGGSGGLKLRDRFVPIGIRDVIIVNSNVEHTEISSKEQNLSYLVIGVEGLELLSGGEDVDSGEGYSVIHYQNGGDQLLLYLRSLLRELEGRQNGYETVCQDLLEVILLLLMRRSQFAVSFVPANRRANRECVVVRRYIEEHFKENLTLDALAKVAHLSKYYLSHAFVREYGVSPMNYVISCRIRESLYLLSETEISLSRIADMLGFSSASYFSQSFRRLKGISPMEYRKRSRFSRAEAELEAGDSQTEPDKTET
jgi:AraC-like DNA-binding protein